MSNFTHYKQYEQMDCGPTCLRMVAQYFGCVFSIQKLREATQIGSQVSMKIIYKAVTYTKLLADS